MHVPKGTEPAARQVDRASEVSRGHSSGRTGKASEALQSRKGGVEQIGGAAKAPREGLNGAMAEWPQQMAVVSSERLYRMRVRTDEAFDASDRQRPVWEVPRDASPTLPAEPPYTRSVRTVAREGASAMGLPIPIADLSGCFSHFFPNDFAENLFKGFILMLSE